MKLTKVPELAWDLLALGRIYLGREVPEVRISGMRDSGMRDSGTEPPTVAVVLGAQVLPRGRPSRTLEARTLHAARLYERGSVEAVIPTGGVGENPPSEAEVMAGILAGKGVPKEAVILEDRALSTRDSAVFVTRIAREMGLEEVLAVTDPLHCVRVVSAFRHAGLRVVAEPVYNSPMWRVRGLRLGQFLREVGAVLWYGVREMVADARRGKRGMRG